MPAGNAVIQRPVQETIEELKAKIALLEGDRKAYYETSQHAMKHNQETVVKLRKEVKELRKKLSDSHGSDAHVIGKAFQDKPVQRASLKNKTGEQAITVMQHKLCDSKKRLNALKHQSASKLKKTEALQTQYDQMIKDSSDAVNTDKGDSVDAQNLRYLENAYDKMRMKIDESHHLCRIYQDINRKLQCEAEKFPTCLDAMEAEIRSVRAELKELDAMSGDAHISKAAAQEELSKHEQLVYAERKKREVELSKMKKEAEEKKMQHERIERRIQQRGSITQDDLTPQDKQAQQGEDQQQKITSYEEAFRQIKEATGCSDTMEVVLRFENQGATSDHLESLKKDNEKQITRLREEKEKLQSDFEEMKYSGEAKLSSGQRMLEDFQSHLMKEEERRFAAEEDLGRCSNIMVAIKAGVEHLADKLHHLKATKGHVPTAKIPATSDEYVLDQLSTCEEKLLKLLEDLDGKDLNEVFKQMEEEEYHSTFDNKLPQNNTRVKLVMKEKGEAIFEDEDDSGEDEGDILSRQAIKKQSQLIVDTRLKRRQNKKKKKTK